MFDLNAYIAERAARAGIGAFEDLALDTYADERAVLQLPPHDPSRRAGLRPADVGYRIELSTVGRQFPFP